MVDLDIGHYSDVVTFFLKVKCNAFQRLPVHIHPDVVVVGLLTACYCSTCCRRAGHAIVHRVCSTCSIYGKFGKRQLLAAKLTFLIR